MITCTLTKFRIILLTILGTIVITNAVEPEVAYKVYPLMLFLASDNTLQRPNALKVSNGILFLYQKNENTEPVFKQELLFCPATKKDETKINICKEAEQGVIENVEQGDYCNIEMKKLLVSVFIKLLSMRREVTKCEKESEPFISKIFSDTDAIQEDGNRNLQMIPCGPNGNGKLYRYGYEVLPNKELIKKVKNNLSSGLTISKVNPNGGIIDYEIYRFCYDAENKEIIYTHHTLMSPQLLSNSHLWRERGKHYDMTSNNFGLEELNFTELEKKYKKLIDKIRVITSSEESFEQLEPSKSEVLPYEPKQLVPANDLVFALWMKTTHHFLNLELMNEKLFRLWNKVLETIRYHARRFKLELNVYTKTFNIAETYDENGHNFEIVLEEEDSEMILKPAQIWIKLVYHTRKTIGDVTRSQGLAIIANNHMNEELNRYIYEYCEIDYCKNFQSEEYPNEYKYVRCCSINERIEKLFNPNPELNIAASGFDGFLDIFDLIDISNITNDLEPNTETEIKTET